LDVLYKNLQDKLQDDTRSQYNNDSNNKDRRTQNQSSIPPTAKSTNSIISKTPNSTKANQNPDSKSQIPQTAKSTNSQIPSTAKSVNRKLPTPKPV
jgi:hypothetical protein